MSGLVSVITPFFNSEKFLRETIESVLNQAYPDWELLLIDDGSTDSSARIAEEYEKQCAGQIRILQHEQHQNRGECASRNLGILRAEGKYVAFLDSDDVWLPQFLQDQISALDQFPEAAMIYGPSLYWYSWSGRRSDRDLDLVQELGVPTNRMHIPPELLFAVDPLGKASSACTCSIVIRKDALDRVGMFDERFVISGDQAFCMKVFQREKVFVSDRCHSKYRRHAESVMSKARNSEKYASARMLFLNWVADFLKQNGIENEKTSRALYCAMWPYHHPRLQFLKDTIAIPFDFLKRGLFRLVGPSAYHQLRRWLKG